MKGQYIMTNSVTMEEQRRREAIMRECYEWTYDAGVIPSIEDTGYLKDDYFKSLWMDAGCNEMMDLDHDAVFSRYKKHLVDNYVPEPAGTTREIKVELTRHYGTISVTLGMSRHYNIHNPGQLSQAIEIMTRQVEQSHRDYINSRSPQTAAGAASHNGSNMSNDLRTEPVTSVLVTHDGKDYKVKVKGGAFEKFGVPIYPEVLEASSLSVESLGMGESVHSGTMVIQMSGNKPKKVIKLELS